MGSGKKRPLQNPTRLLVRPTGLGTWPTNPDGSFRFVAVNFDGKGCAGWSADESAGTPYNGKRSSKGKALDFLYDFGDLPFEMVEVNDDTGERGEPFWITRSELEQDD